MSKLQDWATTNPHDDVELFFWLSTSVNTDRVLELQKQAAGRVKRDRLPSTSNTPEMIQARSEVATALRPALAGLAAIVPPSCADTLETSSFSPFAWCRIQASDVPKLSQASLPRWTFQPESSLHVSWCSNPYGTHFGIDNVAEEIGTACANDHGFFAEGLNVGQLENVLIPYDQNPHWTLAGPDYYSSSNMNKISGPYPQGGTGGSFSCSSSIVSAGSEHATAVAGVIGSESEEGNPGNAAYATLKYGNGDWLAYDVAGLLRCSGDLSLLVQVFDWLVDQNVHILNESFACDPTDGFRWKQERVHSFYARYYDMVIVRAAGNMEDGNGHESEAAHPDQYQVGCRLRNGVCVGSKELRSSNISLFSRYKNTSNTDRDEPDVVAPGNPLELIHGSGAGCGTGCDHEFNGIGGTSMAAPAVAGMAAMVLEQLPDWQGCRQSEWMRAILKASAIDHTEFFVPYWDTAINNWGSEQGPRFARHDLAFGADFENEDDAFGAGMPRFQRMLGWCCGAEDNWVESGDLELLPYDNLPPLNRIHPVLGMDHPNTGGESQLEQGFVYISSETEQPGRSGDSCSNDSLSFCDVPRGESDVQLRRVVVEWSECPDEMPSDPNQTPDSRIPLATDFNVSLTTPSGDTYWLSTSFDDTTEIFEFCAEEPGEYTIQVIPTQLGFGCARTPGDPNQTGEWLYVIESRTRDIDPELACPPLQHYGVGLN